MLNIPLPLSPIYTDSFAYLTFKDRLPVIITRIVDYVYRNKKTILELFGDDKIECVKYITSELSRLRHELTTDKTITLFEGTDFGDEQYWNDAINDERKRLVENGTSEDDEIHWFRTSFLFGENYMYRRIWDIVLKSGLMSFDPFIFEKEELLCRSLKFIPFLTDYHQHVVSALSTQDISNLHVCFEIFLKMSLWGNEADLSLSVTEEESKLKKEEPRVIVKDNNIKLLVDDYERVFEYLYSKSSEESTITFILDNSASELLTDLHLVDFLLSSKLATKVVLMVKALPWYVSDATKADFELTLKVLSDSGHSKLQWLAKRILTHISDHRLAVQTHIFFTLPHPFHRMKALFPDLYGQLSSSTLLIFKGDLNYRKLVSDLTWPHVAVSFQETLLGFLPAPIVALRVMKCDVQVGLTTDALDRAMREHPNDWMITSRYGVVQSAGLPLRC